MNRFRSRDDRRSPYILSLAVALLITSCGGGGNAGGGSAPTGASGMPPVAADTVRILEVPAALSEGVFSQPRNLTVPSEFGIRLWARVPTARFMALAPNGDVLVSVPSEGRIALLRERPGAPPEQFDFAAGLRKPHDMVFHRIGDTTYLYVTESNRVTRHAYRPGDTAIAEADIVVDDLPDSSNTELGGAYGHELKNIAIGGDGKLYVSIGSACNACAEDTVADPVRGAIYQYDADGGNGRLFARGLRNAVGLDFIPGTNTLWAAVNNRDQVRVPVDADVDGDGSSDLGKLLPEYVDDNPPEPFTAVRDGGNYGWPFCNPVPAEGMANLAFVRDFDTNADGNRLDCSSADRVSKGIQAHAAPLGFSFLHDSNLPADYRQGAAVALHGCWNCTSLTSGYKVVYFPFDGNGNAGAVMDLVTGFVPNPDGGGYWGRPVDAIPDGRGNLLISDDFAGAIYQLYPLG